MKKAKCGKSGIRVVGTGGEFPWGFFMVLPYKAGDVIIAFRELSEAMGDLDIEGFGIVNAGDADKGKILTFIRYGSYGARPTIGLCDPKSLISVTSSLDENYLNGLTEGGKRLWPPRKAVSLPRRTPATGTSRSGRRTECSILGSLNRSTTV